MADLQKAFKAALDAAQAVLTEAGESPLTPEQKARYEQHYTAAEGLKAQIDAAARIDALKAWGAESDGQSAVKAGFSREATPTEGNAEEVTADPRTGEIYALGKTGQSTVDWLKSGEYKDAVVDYIKSTGLGRRMKASTLGTMDRAMKILNEGGDTSGGLWAPPDFRAEVVKKMATLTSIRQNAYVFTTGSDIAKFPKVTWTTDDLYTSGVRFGWRAAAAASDISEATNPVAGQVSIPVQLATAAIVLDRSQLEDNQFDLLGYVSQLMAEAFALGEEDAFTTGDGIGKPQGFLSHPDASTAHSGGGMYITTGTSAKLDWGYVTAASGTPAKGILGVEAALPPQYESAAKWMASKNMYAYARSFTSTTGLPIWAPTDSFANFNNGYNATLLGYPILKNQFMATANAADAIAMALGDWGGYYIADRVGLSIEVFREVYGLRDQVVVYARKRVGGQLVHPWKVKILKEAS